VRAHGGRAWAAACARMGGAHVASRRHARPAAGRQWCVRQRLHASAAGRLVRTFRRRRGHAQRPPCAMRPPPARRAHLAVVLHPVGQRLAERRRGARLAKRERRDQLRRHRCARGRAGVADRHRRLLLMRVAAQVGERLRAAEARLLQARLRRGGRRGAARRRWERRGAGGARRRRCCSGGARARGSNPYAARGTPPAR
jgi:hypothetical protein